MPSVRVTVRRYGKNRYRINKKDVIRIKRAQGIPDRETLSTDITINGKTFNAHQRKDGRVEVPKSKVPRSRVQAGFYNVSVHPPKRGSTSKQRIAYGRRTPSHRQGIAMTRFYMQNLNELRTNEIVYDMVKDTKKKLHNYTLIYFRMHFIIETAQGEALPIVMTSDAIDAGEASRSEEYYIHFLRFFVEETLDTAFRVQAGPSASGGYVTFVKWVASLEKPLPVPAMRNI